MMQFKIQGEELELAEGLSLTFKKSNILLAFDDITCERSDSFSIPATPNNTRLLGLAQIPQWHGESMRRKVEAQMVDGTFVQDGFLYVDSYENNEFKAVFVCGENITLKRVKELGKLKDFIWTGVPVGSTPRRVWALPFDTTLQDFGIGVYYNVWSGAGFTPSWSVINTYTRLGFLLTQAANGAGVTLEDVPSVLNTTLLLQPKVYDSQGLEIDPSYWNRGTRTIDMRYNVPDWDFIQLIKLCAAVSGTLLKVENGVISFFSADPGSFNKIDISNKIVKYGTLERKVDGYAKENIMQFANYGSEFKWINGLDNADALIETFSVDNDNLEASKTIYEADGVWSPNYFRNYDNCIFPLSEIETEWDGSQVLTTYKMNDTDYMIATAVTTAQCPIASHNGKVGLAHFSYQGGDGAGWIDAVFKSSTRFSVQVKMSRLEYESIKPETLFYLNGSEYTWKSVEWSNGISTIRMQKV